MGTQRRVRAVAGCGLALLCACGSRVVDVAETEERDGLLFLIGSEMPYSGVVSQPFPDSLGAADDLAQFQTSYASGLREGARIQWHPNGVMAQRQTFVRDATQGTVEAWSETGQLIRRQEVSDGSAHGVTCTWYPTGQLESDAGYAKGALHGTLTRWYANGQKSVERTYRNGHPHGPVHEWYDDGRLKIEGTYADGRVHGPYRRWHANAVLALEAEYHRGQSLAIQMWDEGGVPMEVEPDLQLTNDGR